MLKNCISKYKYCKYTYCYIMISDLLIHAYIINNKIKINIEMTKEHLIRIINNIEKLQITQEEFDSLYTTNINGISISLDVAKSCILFDFEKNEMSFKNGIISASGLFFRI